MNSEVLDVLSACIFCPMRSSAHFTARLAPRHVIESKMEESWSPTGLKSPKKCGNYAPKRECRGRRIVSPVRVGWGHWFWWQDILHRPQQATNNMGRPPRQVGNISLFYVSLGGSFLLGKCISKFLQSEITCSRERSGVDQRRKVPFERWFWVELTKTWHVLVSCPRLLHVNLSERLNLLGSKNDTKSAENCQNKCQRLK